MKRFLKPLEYRDFCLLWFGQSLSSVGNSFQSIALPWMILSVFHGSVSNLTLVMLSWAIPQALLTLVGGIATDRFNARTVILWADGLRVLTAGSIALLTAIGALHIWLLCGILIIHGTANGLFAPAAGSIAPRLVAKEHLESAASLSSIMVQLGPLLGILPAGFLTTMFGPVLAFACNAFSYLIAVGTTVLMQPLEHEQQHSGLSHRDLWEGLRYLASLRWFITMLVMDSLVAIAAISTNSIGVPLLARDTHVGALGYSVLMWSYGCGSIVGLLVPFFHQFRTHRGFTYIFFQGAEAVMLAGVAIVPFPLNALCMIAWSSLNGILVIMSMSLIQESIPKKMLGCAIALWVLASTGLLPVAQMSAGLIASRVGSQTLFLCASVSVMVGAIWGWMIPALRKLN